MKYLIIFLFVILLSGCCSTGIQNNSLKEVEKKAELEKQRCLDHGMGYNVQGNWISCVPSAIIYR